MNYYDSIELIWEATEINVGDSIGVTAVLHRNASTGDNDNFTNIQFSILFPDSVTLADGSEAYSFYALSPCMNPSGTRWMTTGSGSRDADGEAILQWASNVDTVTYGEGHYPDYCFIGFNLTKTRITVNPCQMVKFYVKANEDATPGTYLFRFHTLKYTTYSDDAYTSYDGRDYDPNNYGKWNTTVAKSLSVPCLVTSTENSSTYLTVIGNDATGINDLKTVDTVKTYKTIENGQVYIIRDGVKYNTMGQIVR